MIYRIEREEQLSDLPTSGVEANKIRALFLSYGLKFDFCRFYRQENLFLSALDGSFVICGEHTDIDELSDFLVMNGYTDIFCSEKLGILLSDALKADCKYITLMRYSGEEYSCSLNSEPSLSDVYKILCDGFDIPFEPWYLDMSHRIRHGITKCYVLDGCSTVTVQHDLNGEALISQVATARSERGKGTAARLIRSVCADLSPSKAFVLCEDELIPFYEKVGFVAVDRKCVVVPMADIK